jgi:hypothetical protein
MAGRPWRVRLYLGVQTLPTGRQGLLDAIATGDSYCAKTIREVRHRVHGGT